MDEFKGKMKGLLKKASVSGTKFKGEGRVLGSGSSSQSSSVSNCNIRQSTPLQELRRELRQIDNRASQIKEPSKVLKNSLDSESRESAETLSVKKEGYQSSDASELASGGFSPYGPYISSSAGPRSGGSLNLFQCPVCNSWFKTEEEVNSHVESCLENNNGKDKLDRYQDMEPKQDLEIVAGTFLSGEPSVETLDVMLRLLRNIVNDPGNSKFRKIRMSNPKIQNTVGVAAGGRELLEFIGFKFQSEGDDICGNMDPPSEDALTLISYAISLLEPRMQNSSVSSRNPAFSSSGLQKSADVVPNRIDRQVRVFFPASENMAAKIELPDSFYNLSAAELKQEAQTRRKKIEDSQLLVPKSFREKQAKAARKRYNASVIRIQFPDGVILQGVFLPTEPTSALYEFAASALKEACLKFELLQPAFKKSRVIPYHAEGRDRLPSLEDEELVPSALIKFKPLETDNTVFTGLSNDLLAMSEPLTEAAYPAGR
eukprot:TRINITY_DN7839_c0_g1_i1.p1 TRINITY_DN7839_c0_g1~~TRINITY_DN7839_c0_g1_i1.p1  ORF type:complete len:486 (-),score=89.80 TRINITY_DN7839_c0_g1_i1:165-1622(-)